jgi:hypothetical protein
VQNKEEDRVWMFENRTLRIIRGIRWKKYEKAGDN